MKRTAAERLARTLRAAEAKLSANNRKLIDGFEGVVKVDTNRGHADYSQDGKRPHHGVATESDKK